MTTAIASTASVASTLASVSERDKTKNNEVKIIPKDHEKTWFRWLEDSRPWCISRQLWWGHRIPAYYAKVQGDHKSFENDDIL